MGYFCENCGTKLDNDAVFCANCGYKCSDSKVGIPDYGSAFDLFSKCNWKEELKLACSKNGNFQYSILLTNTAHCPEKFKSAFLHDLKSYLSFMSKKGVIYYVIDLSSQAVEKFSDCDEISRIDFSVKLLNKVYSVIPMKSVMIIGDKNTVGSAKWKNEIYHPDSDSDMFVDSDLPYTTLDTTSLFEKTNQRFLLNVGRLPSSAQSGFPEARRYFKNIQTNSIPSSPRTLVLSALEWINVSKKAYAQNSAEFYSCPTYSFLEKSGLNPIPRPSEHDIYCFNLHGSPTSDYWLSGDGYYGFASTAIPSNKTTSYVICTEACYGAKPTVRSDDSKSILMSALYNGCAAFVGSTQIAYGKTDQSISFGGSISCADILIGCFAKYTSSNYSFGESFRKALIELYEKCESNLRGEILKTLITFALYADPCLSLSADIAQTDDKERRNSRRSLRLTLPNVRNSINMKLSAVSNEIQESLKSYISNNYKSFADTTPVFFEVSRQKGYRAVLSKVDTGGKKILSLYLDSNGNVTDIFTSK